jgi:hypothetical protein
MKKANKRKAKRTRRPSALELEERRVEYSLRRSRARQRRIRALSRSLMAATTAADCALQTVVLFVRARDGVKDISLVRSVAVNE